MKKPSLEDLYNKYLRGTVEKSDKTRLHDLSQRELQTLIAIGLGMRPAEAAKHIGIATRSFSTYRERVLDKLHIRSNAELAIFAFELKLVPSVLERMKENDDERNSVTASPATGATG